MCLVAISYVTHRKRNMEERLLAMPWKIDYGDVIFTANGSKLVVNENTPSGNVDTLVQMPTYLRHVRDTFVANDTLNDGLDIPRTFTEKQIVCQCYDKYCGQMQ